MADLCCEGDGTRFHFLCLFHSDASISFAINSRGKKYTDGQCPLYCRIAVFSFLSYLKLIDTSANKREREIGEMSQCKVPSVINDRLTAAVESEANKN